VTPVASSSSPVAHLAACTTGSATSAAVNKPLLVIPSVAKQSTVMSASSCQHASPLSQQGKKDVTIPRKAGLVSSSKISSKTIPTAKNTTALHPTSLQRSKTATLIPPPSSYKSGKHQLPVRPLSQASGVYSRPLGTSPGMKSVPIAKPITSIQRGRPMETGAVSVVNHQDSSNKSINSVTQGKVPTTISIQRHKRVNQQQDIGSFNHTRTLTGKRDIKQHHLHHHSVQTPQLIMNSNSTTTTTGTAPAVMMVTHSSLNNHKVQKMVHQHMITTYSNVALSRPGVSSSNSLAPAAVTSTVAAAQPLATPFNFSSNAAPRRNITSSVLPVAKVYTQNPSNSSAPFTGPIIRQSAMTVQSGAPSGEVRIIQQQPIQQQLQTATTAQQLQLAQATVQSSPKAQNKPNILRRPASRHQMTNDSSVIQAPKQQQPQQQQQQRYSIQQPNNHHLHHEVVSCVTSVANVPSVTTGIKTVVPSQQVTINNSKPVTTSNGITTLSKIAKSGNDFTITSSNVQPHHLQVAYHPQQHSSNNSKNTSVIATAGGGDNCSPLTRVSPIHQIQNVQHQRVANVQHQQQQQPQRVTGRDLVVTVPNINRTSATTTNPQQSTSGGTAAGAFQHSIRKPHHHHVYHQQQQQPTRKRDYDHITPSEEKPVLVASSVVKLSSYQQQNQLGLSPRKKPRKQTHIAVEELPDDELTDDADECEDEKHLQLAAATAQSQTATATAASSASATNSNKSGTASATLPPEQQHSNNIKKVNAAATQPESTSTGKVQKQHVVSSTSKSSLANKNSNEQDKIKCSTTKSTATTAKNTLKETKNTKMDPTPITPVTDVTENSSKESVTTDYYADEEGVRYVPVKPRFPYPLAGNSRPKPLQNHFNRYSDIKIKLEKRPGFSDVCYDENRMDCYKMGLMAYQFKKIIDGECALQKRFKKIHDGLLQYCNDVTNNGYQIDPWEARVGEGFLATEGRSARFDRQSTLAISAQVSQNSLTHKFGFIKKPFVVRGAVSTDIISMPSVRISGLNGVSSCLELGSQCPIERKRLIFCEKVLRVDDTVQANIHRFEVAQDDVEVSAKKLIQTVASMQSLIQQVIDAGRSVKQKSSSKSNHHNHHSSASGSSHSGHGGSSQPRKKKKGN